MTHDVIAELKALRLHDMAGTWADLSEQNNAELDRSRWLGEQMLRAEATERATRSVSHQMRDRKRELSHYARHGQHEEADPRS